jgi:hypothetical protein
MSETMYVVVADRTRLDLFKVQARETPKCYLIDGATLILGNYDYLSATLKKNHDKYTVRMSLIDALIAMKIEQEKRMGLLKAKLDQQKNFLWEIEGALVDERNGVSSLA